MTERSKRCSAGYSLRSPGAKKHLSDDFEYNFTRLSASANPTLSKIVCPTFKNGSVKRLKSGTLRTQPMSGVCSATHRVASDTAQLDFLKGQTLIDEINLPQEIKLEEDSSDFVQATAFRIHKQSKLDYVVMKDNNDNNEEGINNNTSILGEQFIITGHEEDGSVILLNGGNFSNEDDRIKDKAEQAIEAEEFSDSVCDILPQLRPQDRIECTACHKLLKPGSYRQHLRTHSGAKPFNCEQCVATFTRKGDVERHVRIVHNKQKPFQCPHCMRAFGDKKNLRWHLENHDKRLFYVCAVCGFKFGKREYYENHVRFLHPEETLASGAKSDENKDSPSIGEVGYVMLLPTGKCDELKCLKVPSESDSHFSSKFLESAEPDIGALVIQFNEDDADNEIFSSDILSNECDSNYSEISRVRTANSENKNLNSAAWEQAIDYVANKRELEVNEESAQITDMVLGNTSNQPGLQFIVGCDDLQLKQLISCEGDKEEVAVEDDSLIFQLAVDS